MNKIVFSVRGNKFILTQPIFDWAEWMIWYGPSPINLRAYYADGDWYDGDNDDLIDDEKLIDAYANAVDDFMEKYDVDFSDLDSPEWIIEIDH